MEVRNWLKHATVNGQTLVKQIIFRVERFDGVQQPLHVADGVGAATVTVIGIIDHERDVVIEQEACEADALQGAHDIRGIEISFVDETLREFWYRPLNIAEVDVEDFPAWAEEVYCLHHRPLTLHPPTDEVHHPAIDAKEATVLMRFDPYREFDQFSGPRAPQGRLAVMPDRVSARPGSLLAITLTVTGISVTVLVLVVFGPQTASLRF